jgi:Tfp pilus assembly protein FimV
MKIHNKWVAMAGILLCLLAAQAGAVGLGELKLQSTLNEPFKAEVALTNTANIGEEEIVVGFASAEDFAKRKLEHFFFYSDFQFEVDLNRRVVLISSSRPITEPYLQFILEVRWPAGRLQREYTVLLDMPMRLAE